MLAAHDRETSTAHQCDRSWYIAATMTPGFVALDSLFFRRPPWRLEASAARILAVFATAALILFFGASWMAGARASVTRNAYLTIYISGALLCCVVARLAPGRTLRWEYIGVGIISVPIAIAIGPWSEALGDIIALVFYAGIAVALTSRHRAPDTQGTAHRPLDTAIITVGLMTLTAYAGFLAFVEPSVARPGLYRPLAPAAAVFVILPAAVILRWEERWRLNVATGFVLAGVALAITADIGTVSDVNRFLWATAVWLITMGGMLAVEADHARDDATLTEPPSWWPAAAAGGVYALVALEFGRIEPIATRILIIGGTATASLLLLRQIVALTENQRLLRQLTRIEKREAVGRAIADVAHEFNNLLTAMAGHIELLEHEIRDEHPRGASIRELRLATSNAIILTRSLLGAARPPATDTALVDVNALVQQVVSMFQPTLAGRDLRVNLSVGPCCTRGDSEPLRHAIANVLINARDATPQGGSIHIGTGIVLAGPPPVGLPVREDGYVHVTIQDTGIGMTDEVLARAFEPFFTTKPEGQGTGLGLNLVFSTVRRHGGLVDVQSAPGRGSTFTVWLPKA